MIRSIVKMKSRRNTSQRAIVLSVAKKMYHPSAEEVYAEVKKTESGVGRATVFRNLNLLAEDGEFMKVCFQGEPTRFDTNAKSHDHFMCKRCGRIIDLDRAEFPSDNAEFEKLSEKGLLAENKSVTYYGLCDECLRLRRQSL